MLLWPSLSPTCRLNGSSALVSWQQGESSRRLSYGNERALILDLVRIANVLFAVSPRDVLYWRLPFNGMWLVVLGADL